MRAITKIVVGTDFSEISERALGLALDIAARTSAAIELVHAYSVPSFSLPIEGAVMASASYVAEQSSKLQAQLDATVARHAQSGVRLSAHLRNGVPHEELCNFARQVGADLIVIGTHGRSGPAHVLLGSVAERVLRIADCPVLTVPRGQ
ncbi:MAG: universal stress protein [Polyangiales bacterium]